MIDKQDIDIKLINEKGYITFWVKGMNSKRYHTFKNICIKKLTAICSKCGNKTEVMLHDDSEFKIFGCSCDDVIEIQIILNKESINYDIRTKVL